MTASATALTIDEFQRWRQACFYPKADLPVPDSVLRGEETSLLSDESVARACGLLLGESVTATPLAERGTFHRLWRVHRATARPFICRANAAYRWFGDFPLTIDQRLYSALKPQAIPMVAVEALDLSRRACRTDIALYEEAEGKSLRVFDNDDRQLEPLLVDLGRILACLHRTRVDSGYGLLDVRSIMENDGVLRGVHPDWEAYVRTRLDSHLDTCIAIGAIPAEEGGRVEQLFDEHREIFALDRAALLHGDPGNHNVFAADGRISALIDWEDAVAGDPVYEIAFWASFHPERRHDALLRGYRLEADLPRDFHIRFWLYFLRVALAKTVVRHRLNLTDPPGREPAATRIRKSLQRLEMACV